MPRRNRNAQTPRIDTDELAAQAAQLTAELAATNPATVLVIDESQLYHQFAPMARTGKSRLLGDYITTFLSEHPGWQLTLADAKAVTSHDRI